MAKTTKDHLQNAFEDLVAGDFKRFKSKLCDRREEPRVRRGTIERIEDAIDLADIMVNTFTSDGAVSVTVEILRAIGCNETAEELIKNTGTQEKLVVAAEAAARQTPPSGEHFIDLHLATLIQRVNNVDAILDDLWQKKVITNEDYSTIRACSTKQQKMRELITGPMRSAGNRGKDILYEALKVHEHFLMKELQAK